MVRKLSRLVLVVLAATACLGSPHSRAGGAADDADLPLGQIPGDFDHAEWVAEIRVLAVDPDPDAPADSSGGHVVCVVRASVDRIYKTPGGTRAELRYRFTAEERCGPFPAPDQRLVVFLRADPATGQLWQLAEGAQLPAAPEVLERVRVLAHSARD